VSAFQEFAKQYAVYGYPVLFAGVLLENAGIPVPGETAVLVAGFLASPAGGSHFNIALVIVFAAVAAVLGDNLGFWLGQRFARPYLQRGQRFLFLTPKTLQLAEGYFARHGVWTIFFARFITGLRVIGALAAGTAGMVWHRFFLANAGGAVAWSVTMGLLGYFFGHSWELLHKWLGRGGIILLGSVIVLAGLPYLWRRLRFSPSGLLAGLARAQIWQGVLVAVLEVICIALLVPIAKSDPGDLDHFVTERLTAIGERVPFLDGLALAGRIATLYPVLWIASLLLIANIWYLRRSWRESAALLWALLASEAVGLALLAVLRQQKVEPWKAFDLPFFGFAGLVPIRALAVYGMAAWIIHRLDRRWGRVAYVLAVLLVVLAGFSVLQTGEQLFTEVLLEYVAGGIVLYAGIWWLEGYGPGLRSFPQGQESDRLHQAT
jgi:membrane protein DedA with SNARE-associated domain